MMGRPKENFENKWVRIMFQQRTSKESAQALLGSLCFRWTDVPGEVSVHITATEGDQQAWRRLNRSTLVKSIEEKEFVT